MSYVAWKIKNKKVVSQVFMLHCRISEIFPIAIESYEQLAIVIASMMTPVCNGAHGGNLGPIFGHSDSVLLRLRNVYVCTRMYVRSTEYGV